MNVKLTEFFKAFYRMLKTEHKFVEPANVIEAVMKLQAIEANKWPCAILIPGYGGIKVCSTLEHAKTIKRAYGDTSKNYEDWRQWYIYDVVIYSSGEVDKTPDFRMCRFADVLEYFYNYEREIELQTKMQTAATAICIENGTNDNE